MRVLKIQDVRFYIGEISILELVPVRLKENVRIRPNPIDFSLQQYFWTNSSPISSFQPNSRTRYSRLRTTRSQYFAIGGISICSTPAGGRRSGLLRRHPKASIHGPKAGNSHPSEHISTSDSSRSTNRSRSELFF